MKGGKRYMKFGRENLLQVSNEIADKRLRYVDSVLVG